MEKTKVDFTKALKDGIGRTDREAQKAGVEYFVKRFMKGGGLKSFLGRSRTRDEASTLAVITNCNLAESSDEAKEVLESMLYGSKDRAWPITGAGDWRLERLRDNSGHTNYRLAEYCFNV